ncbi:MAG: VCBS repeat-containing protein [bacterium]|nr:VCBS repeat-containing protein [bacterium]
MRKVLWIFIFTLAFFVSSQCDVPLRLLPADNIWNTPVDSMPVAANSTLYVNTIGSSSNMHADFGSGTWAGGPIGIPFVEVPGNQARVAVVFGYASESDAGPYPIPVGAPIEGGSGSSGDRHVLVLDTDNNVLYETYSSYPQGDGSWTAGSGAIFDLDSNALRPDTWTSADAAGLPILPGLVRYEEVAAGEITHAIRFTAPQTQKAYVWPARHYASSLTAVNYPPLGQRFRLKAGFDISGFSPHAQVILRALKKYGMILADNGSSWYISGAPSESWNNSVLHELHGIIGSNFEAVDVSGLMVNADSGQTAGTANSFYYFHGNRFSGGSAADIAIYRASTGRWCIRGSASIAYGTASDIPVPGDYNGDGTTDIAVFRPSTGRWCIRGNASIAWGTASDIPVPGDYDGDGTTDIAIYRPANGRWCIRGSASIAYGTAHDIPVPADYNGDGTTDIAIYRPSTGRWCVRGNPSVAWGTKTDIPVPADYNGDGSTDIAIYRPSTGRWCIMGNASIAWGTATDVPVPADYNGDGSVDQAVFRPSTGTWHIRNQATVKYGVSTDLPLIKHKKF